MGSERSGLRREGGREGTPNICLISLRALLGRWASPGHWDGDAGWEWLCWKAKESGFGQVTFEMLVNHPSEDSAALAHEFHLPLCRLRGMGIWPGLWQGKFHLAEVFAFSEPQKSFQSSWLHGLSELKRPLERNDCFPCFELGLTLAASFRHH